MALPALIRQLRRWLRRAGRWLLWRQHFILLHRTVEPPPPVPPMLRVEPFEYERREEFLRLLPGELRQRLQRLWDALPASWAFAASYSEGALQYYCFVSTGRIWLEELRAEHSFASGAAYIHSCYTLPEFRGRGLHRGTVSAVVQWLHRNGFTDAYALVEARNIPSRRGFEAIGFRAYLHVWRWNVCGRCVAIRQRRS